jgi:hypothetical protein
MMKAKLLEKMGTSGSVKEQAKGNLKKAFRLCFSSDERYLLMNPSLPKILLHANVIYRF